MCVYKLSIYINYISNQLLQYVCTHTYIHICICFQNIKKSVCWEDWSEGEQKARRRSRGKGCSYIKTNTMEEDTETSMHGIKS